MNKYTVYAICHLEDSINHQVCGKHGSLYIAEVNATVIADSEKNCMDYIIKYLAKMIVMEFYMRFKAIEYDHAILTYKIISTKPVDDDDYRIINLSVVYEEDGRNINESLISGDTKAIELYDYVYNAYRTYNKLTRRELNLACAELKDTRFKCSEL